MSVMEAAREGPDSSDREAGLPEASLPESVRVLAASERVHPSGERFAAVVRDEVAQLELDGTLEWGDFAQLFDHITLRVIFGDGARDDQELTGLLEKLMGEANRLVGLKTG